MEIKYPLAKETITSEELNEVADWLKTNPRLTQGEKVKEFEEAWAKFIGTKYAVFVNSGSSANLISAYAAKLITEEKYGKAYRTLVPSVGWATTIAPTIQFDMKPFMVGIESKTYAMRMPLPGQITSGKIAIMVQVLGVPFNKEKVLKTKEANQLFLIEDACAALGAQYADGSKVGTVGDLSTFSFYFGHQMSTIEGGMVNTNDVELYRLLLMLRSHGWGKDLDEEYRNTLFEKYEIDSFHSPFTFFVPGFNVRGTDLQAFIGLQQMKKAGWMVRRRNENHLRYASNLKGKFDFQDWGQDMPVSISFGVLAESIEHRKKVVDKLVNNGIETRLFSAGNLGLHPFWYERQSKFQHDYLSNRIHSCGFFLPNYPELTLEEVDEICKVLV